MRRYIGFLAVMFLILSACDTKKETANAGSGSVKKQVVEGFSISETNKGTPNWVLDASRAEIYEDQKRVLLKSPDIKFYQEGKYSSRLTASSGRINTENYDIWGDSDCVLTTTNGETLITSNLHYRSDIKKVVTDDNVKLIKPNETIYGKGLEATPDLKSVIIKKQTVEMEDKK